MSQKPVTEGNGAEQSRKRVAIVTGGTRGIGRAVSWRLALQGMRVLAPYARNRRAAAELEAAADKAGLEIRGIRGDLSREAALAATVETLLDEAEAVDIVVHAAATGVHRPAEELSLKHLRWTFETNVLALHALLLALLPRMSAGGRIIGLTSAGGTRTIPAYTAVGASKGALESLLRHYAVELAPRGIAVNLVSPGLVLTGALDAFPDREARIEATRKETPSGRLTTPEDVADVVAFLCSPGAAQIVGQTLVVDGGRTLKA